MITAWYAATYTQMERIAWRHGYALCLHGSMGRDVDVVAVPWVDDAEPAEKLVRAFVRAIYKGQDSAWKMMRVPSKKPHGSRAYVFTLGMNGHYVYLSVMPRRGGRR